MHVCWLPGHTYKRWESNLESSSAPLSLRLRQRPGVSYGAIWAAAFSPLLFCCFDPALREDFFIFWKTDPGCPGWLSGWRHAKWKEVADFIEVWFKEGWGGVWRTHRGRKGRRGRYHKLFYSYPGLPMYAGLVNNASPGCIIRTTTLLFPLTHSRSQLTVVGFFLLPNGCAGHLIDLQNKGSTPFPFFKIHVQM